MKFSLIGHHFFAIADPVDEYRRALEQCVVADELGYDRFLQTEHHLSPYGGPGIYSQLGAYAHATKNIRIGPMVVLTPIHHPIHIAEELAVIDILSDGRLDVGLGRGYRPNTMETFGRQMDDLKDCHEEVVEIVRKCWTQDKFDHDGRFYSFDGIEVKPKPMQQPHPPIVQPVLSPPSIEYCITNGVHPILGAHLVPDEITKMYFDGYRQAVAAGRDPGLELSNQQICIVGESTTEAREAFATVKDYCVEFARDVPDYAGSVWETYRSDLLMLADNLDEAAKRSIVGDPQEVIDRLHFYEELGVDHMILFMDFGPSQEQVLKSMRLFAERVMPNFK